MLIITDNTSLACSLVDDLSDWKRYRDHPSLSSSSPDYDTTSTTSKIFNTLDSQKQLKSILAAVFPDDSEPLWCTYSDISDFFQILLVQNSSKLSQYDLLKELKKQNIDLPDRLLLFAGSGRKFHGFSGRSWAAESGNIHLVTYSKIGKTLPFSYASLMSAATLSVVQAIDQIDGLSNCSEIKWINDILIADKKVAGVLADARFIGESVQDIQFGIGINVLTTPTVKRNQFVPQVSSIAEHSNSSDRILAKLFTELLINLAKNITTLLNGETTSLINKYRNRSMIIGKDITIMEENSDHSDNDITKSAIIAQGEVINIGDNLEIYLKNSTTPIVRGRVTIDKNSN